MNLKVKYYILTILMALSFQYCSDNATTPEEKNGAPLILTLIASPDTLDPENSTTIVCLADDPNDDAIEFKWNCSLGNIVGAGDTVRRFEEVPEPDVRRSGSIVRDRHEDLSTRVARVEIQLSVAEIAVLAACLLRQEDANVDVIILGIRTTSLRYKRHNGPRLDYGCHSKQQTQCQPPSKHHLYLLN